MNTPTVSLLHATKGRPEKCIAAMKLWAERATNPGAIEYIIAYERDDVATEDHLDEVLSSEELPWFSGGALAIRGAFGGSAPAWNAAHKAASGALLVQVSDDSEPPQDWDAALLNRLSPQWEQERIVIAVSDGLRRDNLMTVAICTAAYAKWKGEFLHPGFQSMYSDDDFSFRAFKHQNEGECRVIPAKELVFLHRHHCANPDVPEDDTYRWQNRPEAYAAGRALFIERNPHAYGKDAKLWL
jgi:hypothetical protein